MCELEAQVSNVSVSITYTTFKTFFTFVLRFAYILQVMVTICHKFCVNGYSVYLSKFMFHRSPHVRKDKYFPIVFSNKIA